MRFISFLLAATWLLLAGCGTAMQIASPSRQTFTNYRIDQPMNCAIGEPMIEVERASVLEAYEARFDFQSPSIGVLSISMPFIRKGDRFTAVIIVPSSPNERMIREEGPERRARFISISTDGRIKRGWTMSDGISPVQGSWPTDPPFLKSDEASRGENSFKAQLIYSGLSGSTIKFAYREFSDDYARPAFSQDLQYDLNESKTVAYKSLRIEITSATNSMLQYVVKYDGSLPWLPK